MDLRYQKIGFWMFAIACSLATQVSATTITGKVIEDDALSTSAEVNLLLVGSGQVTSTTVNSDGEFEFLEVGAGNYRLQVVTDSVTTAQSKLTVDANSPEVIQRAIWLVTPTPETETFTISGVMADLNGRTYADSGFLSTEVAFSNTANGSRYVTKTGSDGTYSIDVPAGEYTVNYYYAGNIDIDDDGQVDVYSYYYGTNLYAPIAVSAATQFDITIPVKEVDIDATLDAVEQPASLTFFDYENVSDPAISGWGYSQFYVSVDDTFINALMPVEREINLTAKPAYSEPPTSPVFPGTETFTGLTANTSVDVLEIPLSESGVVLTATISDMDGNLLPGACVSVYNQTSTFDAYECSDGNGQATFYLPEGTFTITHNNYSPIWDNASSSTRFYFSEYENYEAVVQSGEVYSTDTQEFTVPVFVLNGEVVRDDFSPAVNAEVGFFRRSGTIDYDNGNRGYVDTLHNGIETDENGQFSIYVSPYANEFWASEEGASATISFDQIVQGEFLTIQLGQVVEPPPPVEGENILSGTTRNLVGMPIPANVTLYTQSFEYIDTTQSGTDGIYEFADLVQGSYRVLISPTSSRALPLAVSGSRYNLYSDVFTVSAATSRDFFVPLYSSTVTAVDLAGTPIPGIGLYDDSSAAMPKGGTMTGDFVAMTDDRGLALFTQAYQDRTELTLRSSSVPFDMLTLSSVFNKTWQFDIIYLGTAELEDSDSDRIPDFYEDTFTALVPGDDPDSDTLTNYLEYRRGSSPVYADTDADGLLDGTDAYPTVAYYAHPVDLTLDSDNDGTTNEAEILAGTDYLDGNDFPRLISDYPVADSALQACIEQRALDQGHEYTSQFTYIRCDDEGVTTLEGLQYFTSVTFIDVQGNPITDASPIEGMESLEKIWFNNTQIGSLEFLKTLPNLREIKMNLDYVTDFSPLYYATALEDIFFFRGELADLGFLANMPKLTRLDLWEMDNLANQMFKIANVPSLEHLNLGRMTVNNLNFLAPMSGLKTLFLDGMSGLDFSIIAQLGNLEGLSVWRSNISDISFVASMTGLTALDFRINQIADISSLRNLIALSSINLQNNPVECTDVSSVFYSLSDIADECFDIDTDGDGIVDRLDDDDDGDGISDAFENAYGLDALDASDAGLDADGDGLTNLEEFTAGTDPTLADTDGDGVFDAYDSAPLSDSEGVAEFYDADGNSVEDLLTGNILTNGILSVDTGSQSNVVVGDANGPDLPAWFSAQQVQAVPDANGTASWDILILGQARSGEQLWMLYESQFAQRLQMVTYPGYIKPQSQKQAIHIADVNGNAYDEVVILIERADGRDGFAVFDLNTGDLLRAVLLPGWFDGASIHSVSDWSGNGASELVIYGETSGGSPLWLKYDSLSGASLGSGSYPGWFEPAELHVGADIDGNGTESLITLGQTSGGAKLWIAQDARSGATRRTHGYPGWLTPQSLMVIDDTLGDDKADVVVLAQTPAGSWLWRRTDIMTRATQRQTGYPGWFTPSRLDTVGDINGNGVPEVATFGSSSSNMPLWLKQDGSSGVGLGTIGLPDDYGPLH